MKLTAAVFRAENYNTHTNKKLKSVQQWTVQASDMKCLLGLASCTRKPYHPHFLVDSRKRLRSWEIMTSIVRYQMDLDVLQCDSTGLLHTVTAVQQPDCSDVCIVQETV